MSIKKIGAVLVAVLALSAIAVNSASAAVSTTAAEWYTGTGLTTTLAGDTAVTASLVGASTTLKTEVAGTEVELKATGLSCVSCQITNEEVTGKTGKVAVGDGQIRFTGATVVKPANCTVRGTDINNVEEPTGQITSWPLKVHADWMDTTTTNQHAFIDFFPTAGKTEPFAVVMLEGPTCGVAGSYFVEGSVMGESANNTGVAATSQNITLNSTVQSTTGSTLHFGEKTAVLTGTAAFSAMGESFGIK